ncbi:MAG: class I SAM-dependent methyltransferase [Candidatus Bathyarchaeia archaeon]
MKQDTLASTPIAHKRIVRQYYSKRASDYDRQKERTWKSELGFEVEVMKEIMQAARKGEAGFGLEAGVGSGRVLVPLTKETGLPLIGLDLSREMLKLAGEKIGSFAKMSDLLLGDIEVLPFRNSSFDLLLCISTLHYFFSPAIALMEFSRVLKEGGIFIYGDVTMHEMDTDGFMDKLEKTISTAHGGYYRPSEVRSFMEECGIHVAKIRTIPYRKSFESLSEDKGKYFNVEIQTLKKFLLDATGKNRALYELGKMR